MLKVQSVHKHFRGVHALKDVSLSVGRAEILALVGDNGAGKSTLMKCVSGVLNPDEGSIWFNEIELTRAHPPTCRQAGIEMIYQDLALCRGQDVLTNVFLGQERRKGLLLDKASMRRTCIAAFEELEIEIRPEDVVGRLSGGQQQSVAIARAMVAGPKLLVMDEPTAALSARETARVLALIRKLKDRAVSVVMVTHRLSDVFEAADRIIVMKQGEARYDLEPAQTDIRDLTIKIIEG